MKNRDATYDDLCKLPEHLVGELIDGELFASPRPASPHAMAAGRIFADAQPFDRRPGGPTGPGGWWILFEPELHFGRNVLVPDVAGWRHERMPRVPNVAAFELAPDWLCEVQSPSTGKLDRAKKLPRYARAGVSHVWIVEPILRTLEVFRLENSRYSLLSVHSDVDVVHAEPFDVVAMDLSRWWLDTDEPASISSR